MLPPDDSIFARPGSDTAIDLERPPGSSHTGSTPDSEETILWVRNQIDAANPIAGTLAERYLANHRALRPPWPVSLRWSENYRWRFEATPRPCLLAAVTNAAGEVVAVQSIELDLETGKKSHRTDKPKLSRGPVGEGAVFLGNSGELATTLVIGEGLETTMTRCLVGPCDAHACLGVLRFIEPKRHHRRVEILADTNGRNLARRMARDYAKRGLAAYVVTVPDSLGPKADLNDALRELGATAVLMAVEDAGVS